MSRTRLHAQLLVPGRGEPLRDAVVDLDDTTISYAGPAAGAPVRISDQEFTVPTVMPGLWDCHTHLTGVRSFDLSRALLEPVARRAARAAGDLRAALAAGVTSVRDAGGFAIDLAAAVRDGSVLGPTIHAAGAILSTTGGHGDLHDLPLEWVHDLMTHESMLRLCDGPDACATAVREQLRRNAAVIKICASGGVLSEVDDPIHQQFTDAELATIVEVAGLAQRSVMAHCHGKPGIMAAVEAGVRTVEHGTYLDEECCAAMVERDVLLVPTRLIVTELAAVGAASGMSPAMLDKLFATAERHADALTMAHEAGVRIAMGTDVAASGRHLPAAWGNHGRELALMQASGLGPLEVLEAATANGPDTLGLQAPRSGQLVAGYDADVITVDGDPTADLTVLADPANIGHVFVGGRRVAGAAA
ncbi:MAG: amidohydrolase family protein [Nitriliruptoraceae bacterium]|nr:amidohydrolase family protein [Nitriliruptoraceae bacterium]